MHIHSQYNNIFWATGTGHKCYWGVSDQLSNLRWLQIARLYQRNFRPWPTITALNNLTAHCTLLQLQTITLIQCQHLANIITIDTVHITNSVALTSVTKHNVTYCYSISLTYHNYTVHITNSVALTSVAIHNDTWYICTVTVLCWHYHN